MTKVQCSNASPNDDRPWNLSLQNLMDAIADVANSAVFCKAKLPALKGMMGKHSVQGTGIDAEDAKADAFRLHKYCTCEATEETRVLEKLCKHFARDGHPAKERAAEIKVHLQG